ncbi:MAG: universal stress protein [Rhodobacterales bacterium]|nr:MAG: universal stress protein [Rhodobacterales bacterium]
MKTVLCAIDINRPDDDHKILRRAAQLAELDGAKLDVITVMPDFGSSMVAAYFSDHKADTMRQHAKELVEKACIEALGAEANKSIRHIVVTGNVYEEVLHCAKADGADLIVIGAHRPDLKDYLLGPNAARVVRHSECSVYVVR